MVDGLLRAHETPRDLGIREPLREQQQYLHLAFGESRGIRRSRRTRASRNTAYARCTHAFAQCCRCRLSAKGFQNREGLAPRLLVAFGEREGALEWTSDLPPQLGRLGPASLDLSCVGRLAAGRRA